MRSDIDDWERYKEEEFSVDTEKASSTLAAMAESWYDSITEERIKKKMMVNYIVGVTDDGAVTREEAIKMLEDNDVI